MDLLTWLIVGLVAGVLASMIMGGTGFGIVGDIIIGIAGAFVGSWLLRHVGTGAVAQKTGPPPVGGGPARAQSLRTFVLMSCAFVRCC